MTSDNYAHLSNCGDGFFTQQSLTMSVSWESFERYRQKGLDARRAMQWDSARLYLLEAARAMTTLAKEATSDELRTGREQIAARLLELARDCDVAKKQNRRTAGAGS